MILAVLGLGALMVIAPPLQTPDSGLRTQAPLQTPDSGLTVTLITYEQGGSIYERYGHNAIWIHDAATGTDEHYDYGRFSFQQENFVLRFLQGRMWYSMGFESNLAGIVGAYVAQGRKVWMQELDLPPQEKVRLREFLAWNYHPENRDYAYDYYRDNCSTRIRDVLDRALGGAIRRFGETPSGWTWRDETRRLNQHNPVLYTALLLVLGRPVDREMSLWEQMFLPMRLREALNQITITGPDGVARPAVRSERLVAQGGRWPAPERPSGWLPGYLVLGLLMGGAFFLIRRTRAFVPLATLWLLLVGILGGFILWAWLFTWHRASYDNENVFLFNLVALALAIVLPAASRGRAWAAAPARVLALALAAIGVSGLLFLALPWSRQHNGELFALMLPAHLAIAWGVLTERVRRGPRQSPAPVPGPSGAAPAP